MKDNINNDGINIPKKDPTGFSLRNLKNAILLTFGVLAYEGVHAQTPAVTNPTPKDSIKAMKGGNDTAILANNGPTTPAKSNDQVVAGSIDTDKDGISDSDEIKYGTDPKVRDDFFGTTNTGATSDGGKNLLNSADKKLAKTDKELAEEKQKLAEAKKLEETLLSKP